MNLLPLLSRDLRLGFSRGAEGAVGLAFFAAVIALFPFALGGDPAALEKAAPGAVWIAMLLASLLSLEAVWHRDYEDGTLDLLLLSQRRPLELAFAKTLAHWALSGLPLALAAVPAAAMLGEKHPLALLPGLLLGGLHFSLLGGFAAALTCGARRPGLLIALLVLPLAAPMLALGLSNGPGALPLQAALTLFALALAPLAASRLLLSHTRS